VSDTGWDPIHHEDLDQQPEPPARAARQTKAALKPDEKQDGAALVLTIPPTFAASMWSLAEARDLLTRIGLGTKAAEFPDRLSGGQQQRVAIVRCLAMNPKLLLLDEITSALDPELVGEVLSLVGELADLGMTMLLATHEMGFARDVADQVCFLENGLIVESGTPEKIFGDPDQAATRRFLQRTLDQGGAG
jgi:ABC-type polar amino acid transport system ATPase subunit